MTSNNDADPAPVHRLVGRISNNTDNSLPLIDKLDKLRSTFARNTAQGITDNSALYFSIEAMGKWPELSKIIRAAFEVVAIDRNPNHGIGKISEALDILRQSCDALHPPNSVLGSAQPASPGLGGAPPQQPSP
jgi:hypothetical protein